MALSKRPTSSQDKLNLTFHKAAASGNLDAVAEILATGVDINQVDERGYTALILAAESAYRYKEFSKTHLDTIRFLIAQGADPNIIGPLNSTALDFAVMKCCPEVVKLLYPITKNITVRHFGYLPDPNDWDWDFSTWLQTVTILKDFGINFNKLWSGANFDKGLFSTFFCQGDHVSSTEAACKAMDFILSHMTSQDFVSCEREILDTLICHIDDKTTFEIYLSKLVLAGLENIDAKDSYDQTALHWAAIKGHLAAAEVLVEFGADVNNTQRHHLTPLHFAAAGHVDITKLLLKADANPRMLDDKKRDPVQYSKDECISQQRCYNFSKTQYLEEFKTRYNDAQIAITAHIEKISKALRANRFLKANSDTARAGLTLAEKVSPSEQAKTEINIQQLLDQDDAFANFRCIFTMSIIASSDVVKFGNQYYQGDKIREWVKEENRDPLTNLPFTLADLKPCKVEYREALMQQVRRVLTDRKVPTVQADQIIDETFKKLFPTSAARKAADEIAKRPKF